MLGSAEILYNFPWAKRIGLAKVPVHTRLPSHSSRRAGKQVWYSG